MDHCAGVTPSPLTQLVAADETGMKFAWPPEVRNQTVAEGDRRLRLDAPRTPLTFEARLPFS